MMRCDSYKKEATSSFPFLLGAVSEQSQSRLTAEVAPSFSLVGGMGQKWGLQDTRLMLENRHENIQRENDNATQLASLSSPFNRFPRLQ